MKKIIYTYYSSINSFVKISKTMIKLSESFIKGLKNILILISFIVIIGCIILSLKYIEYKKNKDETTDTCNEETISILTCKISELFRKISSNTDGHSDEGELCRYRKTLVELSEELLYINSRNTERINKIAKEINSLEIVFNTH